MTRNRKCNSNKQGKPTQGDKQRPSAAILGHNDAKFIPGHNVAKFIVGHNGAKSILGHNGAKFILGHNVNATF